MSNFLSTFKKIIREAEYTNTYKMSWAKALVELSNDYKNEKGIVEIRLEQIAERVLKYYWDQTIFFDLIQGSNLTKTPIIVQYVKELIEDYYRAKQSHQPIVFNRVIDRFKELNIFDKYQLILGQITKALTFDVSYRFLNISNGVAENIYHYTKGSVSLFIKGEDLLQLYINQQDLYDLINYRWRLILNPLIVRQELIRRFG